MKLRRKDRTKEGKKGEREERDTMYILKNIEQCCSVFVC
jgi:hypothetical protein